MAKTKLPAGTELERLKRKCLNKDGTPKKTAKAEDLVRLKVLIDAEPLTKEDIEEAKRREKERQAKAVADYQNKKAQQLPTQQEGPAEAAVHQPAGQDVGHVEEQKHDPSLDIPKDHPRIMKLKEALQIFTKIECHPSRPDDFILFTRGVAITAGDVRAAQRAMNI